MLSFFFLLALASLAWAAGSYDQCYFEAGYVGPQSLLPCLSANETQNGVSWCCLAGHYCVNQACYDASSGVTYQYGCNDPTYKDKNCPVKGGLDPGEQSRHFLFFLSFFIVILFTSQSTTWQLTARRSQVRVGRSRPVRVRKRG